MGCTMTTTIGSLTFVIDGKPAEAGAQVVVRSLESIREAARKVGAETSGNLDKLAPSFRKLADIKAPNSEIVQRMGAFAAMARQLNKITAPSDDVTNKLTNFFTSLANLKVPNSNSLTRLASAVPILSTLNTIKAPSSATVANISAFFDALANARTPKANLVSSLAAVQQVMSGRFTAPSAASTKNLTNFFSALANIQVPTNLGSVTSALNQIAAAASNAGAALRSFRGGLQGLNTQQATQGLHGMDGAFRGLLASGTPANHMLFQTRAALQGLFATMGVRELVQVNIEIQQVTAALMALTGSADAARTNFNHLLNVSDRFGIDISTAATGYKRLLASIEGTEFSMGDAQKMFTNISKSARVLGLDSENVMGVFRALEQIISKGSLQAEELRGQLGDRLPGAFNMFAKAIGVSTAQLGDLMKQGKITGQVLHDSLIKFTDLYAQKVEGGLVTSTQSMQAELTRLMNSIKMAAVLFGESGFNEAVANFARAATDLMNSEGLQSSLKALGAVTLGLQENFETLAAVVATVFGQRFLMANSVVATFLGNLRAFAPTVGIAAATTTGLQIAVTSLTPVLLAAGAAFLEFAIPAAVIGGIVYLLTYTEKLADSAERAARASKELTRNVTDKNLDPHAEVGKTTSESVKQAIDQNREKLATLRSEIEQTKSEIYELTKPRSGMDGLLFNLNPFNERELNLKTDALKKALEAQAGMEKNAITLDVRLGVVKNEESFRQAMTDLNSLRDATKGTTDPKIVDMTTEAFYRLADAHAKGAGNVSNYAIELKRFQRILSGIASDRGNFDKMYGEAFKSDEQRETFDKMAAQLRKAANEGTLTAEQLNKIKIHGGLEKFIEIAEQKFVPSANKVNEASLSMLENFAKISSAGLVAAGSLSIAQVEQDGSDSSKQLASYMQLQLDLGSKRVDQASKLADIQKDINKLSLEKSSTVQVTADIQNQIALKKTELGMTKDIQELEISLEKEKFNTKLDYVRAFYARSLDLRKKNVAEEIAMEQKAYQTTSDIAVQNGASPQTINVIDAEHFAKTLEFKKRDTENTITELEKQAAAYTANADDIVRIRQELAEKIDGINKELSESVERLAQSEADTAKEIASIRADASKDISDYHKKISDIYTKMSEDRQKLVEAEASYRDKVKDIREQLIESEKKYAQTVADSRQKMIDAEQRYADAIEKANRIQTKDSDDVNQKMRELYRRNMSDAEKEADVIAEAQERIAKARQLVASGGDLNLEDARAQVEAAQALAMSLKDTNMAMTVIQQSSGVMSQVGSADAAKAKADAENELAKARLDAVKAEQEAFSALSAARQKAAEDELDALDTLQKVRDETAKRERENQIALISAFIDFSNRQVEAAARVAELEKKQAELRELETKKQAELRDAAEKANDQTTQQLAKIDEELKKRDELNNKIAQYKTDVEEINKRIQTLTESYAPFNTAQKAANDNIAKMSKNFGDLQQAIVNASGGLDGFAKTATANLTNVLNLASQLVSELSKLGYAPRVHSNIGIGASIPGVSSFANGGVMTSSGSLPLNYYSNGGVANSPQVAIYGEGRGPEAYVPLPDGRSIPVTVTGNVEGSSGPTTIYITIEGSGDPEAVADAVIRKINEGGNGGKQVIRADAISKNTRTKKVG